VLAKRNSCSVTLGLKRPADEAGIETNTVGGSSAVTFTSVLVSATSDVSSLLTVSLIRNIPTLKDSGLVIHSQLACGPIGGFAHVAAVETASQDQRNRSVPQDVVPATFVVH